MFAVEQTMPKMESWTRSIRRTVSLAFIVYVTNTHRFYLSPRGRVEWIELFHVY